MNSAIEIQKLTKIYKASNHNNGKAALDNLDLSVPRGSVFGLLGPNGAGKSTLINILAGTVVKSSGRATIMGHDIELTPKLARQHIGIVPQDVVLEGFFTLEQALEFTAGYYGLRPEERRTVEILRALSLLDKKDAYPRQLSGGMKRRFMIAKAMAHSPQVLVLDEPSAGVDIELREQLWEYIRKLNKEGITIIITTHYLAEAQELCDQIAFINHGKIIKQDSTENLLNLACQHLDVEFAGAVNNLKLKFSNDIKFDFLSENKIRFQLQAANHDFNSLLSDIQNIGLPIKDLKISQVDLEDVFKKVIR